MSIRFFDMFSGIGGFRSGLEAVGGFECIGHCEIDRHANQAYNAIYQPKGEFYCDDARKINPETMPDFDVLCAVISAVRQAELLPKLHRYGKTAWIRHFCHRAKIYMLRHSHL